MEKNLKNKIDKKSKIKLQLIINKNLFSNKIISSTIYEQMEASLLEKIESLNKELSLI